MKITREKFWKLGRNLLWASLVGLMILATTAELVGNKISAWIPIIGNVIGILFVVGGIIVWSFGIRFYARVHEQLGVTRSAIYLAILIGMNWLSSFIFIAVEGRDRFFGAPTE